MSAMEGVDWAVMPEGLQALELAIRSRHSIRRFLPIQYALGYCNDLVDSLSLEPCSLKVDRMGILANGEGEPEDADTLDFPELISRDRRRYLVTLARVECEEARRSVKEAIDQQRRYVVI